MLFYERVVKKPIRIRVDRTEYDRLRTHIQFDKNRNLTSEEYIRKIDFMPNITLDDPISREFFKVNDNYKRVVEENKRATFEVEVYNKEFLSFIPNLLQVSVDT